MLLYKSDFWREGWRFLVFRYLEGMRANKREKKAKAGKAFCSVMLHVEGVIISLSFVLVKNWNQEQFTRLQGGDTVPTLSFRSITKELAEGEKCEQR